jgi:hypothetical protein
MAFDDIWNPTYEGLPADNENIALGAGRIRDLKVNVRERAGIDHSWGDTADNGQHNKVTFNQAGADPTPVSLTGFLYTKNVAGATELFWEDAASNILQLTAAGKPAVGEFASGTSIVFGGTAPPTGWTQVTTNTDAVLRLVNDGSGGGTGGTWDLSTVPVTTTVTTTVATTTADNGSTVSGTVAGHAVTILEMPIHDHTFDPLISAATIDQHTPNVNGVVAGHTTLTTASAGGGNTHAHGWSGTLGLTLASVSTGSSSATSTLTNNAAYRPKYVNVILATKN